MVPISDASDVRGFPAFGTRARDRRCAGRLRAAAGEAMLTNPTLDRLVTKWGERYWQQSVGRVAGTLQYEYPTPIALGNG
jgi:hypothetical protein